MDTGGPLIVSLQDALQFPADLPGTKARSLSLCRANGFQVPDGWVLTAGAYDRFVHHNGLRQLIDFEMFKKPLDHMRWEEIWDVAFRIRSAFVKGAMPAAIVSAVEQNTAQLDESILLAVRSSAPSEDSATGSFAGMHESYLHVRPADVLEKVRLVWASLWSDRSLLYRKEKQLDSRTSTMAVLVQIMVPGAVSGLAFSADPLTGQTDVTILEIVPGWLDQLVDNLQEPERIRMEKQTGHILLRQPVGDSFLLADREAAWLNGRLQQLETLFKTPVDVEWTKTGDDFTVLQVRPITTLLHEAQPERRWHLSLTPGSKAMQALADKVEHTLIPQLRREVEAFGAEDSVPADLQMLVQRLRRRGERYRYWKQVYQDQFIPFAHGIRTFGMFYNELMKPEDPYAFVQLLRSNQMLAQLRNRQFFALAAIVQESVRLQQHLCTWLKSSQQNDRPSFLPPPAKQWPEAERFQTALQRLLKQQMDVFYDHRSLADDPRTLLKTILALAQTSGFDPNQTMPYPDYNELKEAFLRRAGPQRQAEALNWLRIGRLSWQLRDDDNILLGKLEHQLLLSLREGLARLHQAGLLETVPSRIALDDWESVLEGLEKGQPPVLQPIKSAAARPPTGAAGVRPRQLVGHPASPGIHTAKARVLFSMDDFGDMQPGEVVVIDAVQPQMTFIIPIAGGIVERRGGMLVHSSIIARELGIPAVNGVSRATELIQTGDVITVNGDMGLVVVGEADFELERSFDSSTPSPLLL